MPAIPPAITRDLFRRVCAQFATGITVVTTRDEAGTPHGMTVNSFTSVSAEPPLVLVCIDRSCSLLTRFQSSPYYGINVLSSAQQELSVRFAQTADPRFEGVAWHSGSNGVPLLDHALAHFECRTLQQIDAGDHVILLGEVIDCRCSPGKPLLYHGSRYCGLNGD